MISNTFNFCKQRFLEFISGNKVILEDSIVDIVLDDRIKVQIEPSLDTRSETTKKILDETVNEMFPGSKVQSYQIYFPLPEGVQCDINKLVSNNGIILLKSDHSFIEEKNKMKTEKLNELSITLQGNEEKTSPVIEQININILMLGIDGAGKTTFLYKTKMGETVLTEPTIGFNMESIQFRNINFTIRDVGGQLNIRKLWKHYYEGTNGFIYVVDSNDVKRIEESALELENLLREEELKNAVLLVLANKQDLPKSVSVSELTERLGLHRIRDRPWNVQAICGITGDGIYEGMEWLAKEFEDSNLGLN